MSISLALVIKRWRDAGGQNMVDFWSQGDCFLQQRKLSLGNVQYHVLICKASEKHNLAFHVLFQRKSPTINNWAWKVAIFASMTNDNILKRLGVSFTRPQTFIQLQALPSFTLNGPPRSSILYQHFLRGYLKRKLREDTNWRVRKCRVKAVIAVTLANCYSWFCYLTLALHYHNPNLQQYFCCLTQLFVHDYPLNYSTG